MLRGGMSLLFLVTLHSYKLHPAWVIAINNNSRLPNDVMSRQGLIDRWEGGYVPEHVQGGVLAKHALGYMSSLFLETVHSLKPQPA